MKTLLLASVALVGLATVGARAAEEYPTPVSRPITSSVPTLDVGPGGGWNNNPNTTVTMHNSGYTAATGIDGFPKFRPETPAVAVAAPNLHHS